MSDLPTPSLPEVSGEHQMAPSPLAASVPVPTSAHHSNKRIVLIGGAVVVGIGALCGLGYAAWAGYVPNPFMPRPTTDNVLRALHNITSAQTTVDVHFAIENKEADVAPLDFSLFEDKSSTQTSNALVTASQMLPSDLDLTLAITSAFSNTNNQANQETQVNGTYTGNNVSANINITTRSVDGVTYVKPDAIPLPIPIFDMNALEGKWINMDGEEESRDVFSYEDLRTHTPSDKDAEKITDARGEFFALLQQAIQDGAIVFSVPERVTEGSERVWQTSAVINGEKLRETIITMGENRDTLFPTVTNFTLFTDTFLEATGKERAKDSYREIFSRTTLNATLKDDGTPVTIAFATRIAPKLANDTLKDRQITLETKVHFNSINAPVTISAPENAINTDAAVALLMGTSVEEGQRKDQLASVKDIRTALDMYHETHKSYPTTLNELIGTKNNSKTVTNIPLDVFTEKPYVYTTTETGYALEYIMSADATTDTFSLYDTTVEGTNTATEVFFSVEGAKITDEDEDGLTAFDENTYGTNDKSTDTDHDGFNDKIEIDGGYNPVGEGLLLQE